MIGIRVDANSMIATGHMMRCITIARAVISGGESVTFFIADEESGRLLDKNRGDLTDINIVVLGSAWDDMEGELPILIEQLQLRGIDTLLVDSYKVTYDYFKAIDRVCRTAYIDDLHEGIYPVDILINYSGYYDMFDYERDYSNVHGHDTEPARLLLGLMYAPLREQFHTDDMGDTGDSHDKKSGTALLREDANSDEIKGEEMEKADMDILFACGGADTQDMILPTLKVVADRGLCKNSMVWHTVVGDYVENAESIEAFASMHDGIKIHRSVQDMASLMRCCDLAVVAAGTMLTECAAMKLPAVFYQVADNQRYGVEYWSKPDRMIYAGDVCKDKDGVIAAIIREVSALSKDRDRLSEISKSIGSITDGKGAKRIAEIICEENETSYHRRLG